jgi:hypothetical protein
MELDFDMFRTVICHVTVQALRTRNVLICVTGPEGHPAYCKWLQGLFLVGTVVKFWQWPPIPIQLQG